MENGILLSRVFTRNTLRDIVKYNHSETFTNAIRKYIVDPSGKDNGQLISELYSILKKEYRNEYFYKNTILNKLLLGVHKPTTTTALSEVSIGQSKADFVLINGNAIVYEIKTELDNLDRLESQLVNYYKAFTRVSVLTYDGHVDSLQRLLEGSPVGISVLTRKGTIRKRKEPQEYISKLNQDTMFRILRKQEYEHIIERVYGSLPDVSQFEYYRACKELFCRLDTDMAYYEFINTLKGRGKIDMELYSDTPYELKFLVYFSGFREDDYKKLNAFIQKKEEYLCTSLI